MDDYLKYIAMKSEISSICSFISGNPCSTVSTEISNIISDLQSSKATGDCDDSISSSINNIISQFVSNFSAIQGSVNSTFKSSEAKYRELLSAIEKLETEYNEYQELINNPPSTTGE